MNRSKTRTESPDYAKISHATAISLGLVSGRMYRGAVNRCVNLLVHYPEGCSANCAYCGLAKRRPGSFREKSFIHVAWPVYTMKDIIAAIKDAPPYVRRTCISMITNKKCRKATLDMARRLTLETDLPLSVLISPTVLEPRDLLEFKKAGVDKIGVAVDLATPELFDKYRGSGVSGPHKWQKYLQMARAGLDVFGADNVGIHLMVGMGESEEEMIQFMDRLWGMGMRNHLFSFFAEEGSKLADRPQPPWPTYLRVQLARYLIEEESVSFQQMRFNARGQLIDFGLDECALMDLIRLGTPFMTTGCHGPDGKVACNRPFGNCLPDVRQWNYPYRLDQEETALIREHIFRSS